MPSICQWVCFGGMNDSTCEVEIWDEGFRRSNPVQGQGIAALKGCLQEANDYIEPSKW